MAVLFPKPKLHYYCYTRLFSSAEKRPGRSFIKDFFHIPVDCSVIRKVLPSVSSILEKSPNPCLIVWCCHPVDLN